MTLTNPFHQSVYSIRHSAASQAVYSVYLPIGYFYNLHSYALHFITI